MSQINEASVLIDKPIHEVWSFVTDFNNYKFYWEGFRKVEFASEETTGEVGTRYNLYFKSLFNAKKVPVEISQKLAVNQFEFKNISNSANILTGFRFEEKEGKTMVTMYRKSGLGPLASVISLDFISGRGAVVEFEKILKELKKYLENDGVSDPLSKTAMAKSD